MPPTQNLERPPSTAVIEEQREIDASILNLSGRQRMLSQRIALFLMRLALCSEQEQCQVLRHELRYLVELLTTTHKSLIYGDAKLRLPDKRSDAIHEIYFAKPIDLDRQLTNYAQQVNDFLNKSDEALSIDDPTLQRLIGIDSVKLLQALEVLVSQYARESEARQTDTMNELINLCQEHRVALKTVQTQATQLNQTLDQLHKTQARLLQSEKMLSLGQLVAGVAHEINNPVNFIHGNLRHASDYSEDLTKLIQVYQKHYPEPVPAIVEYLNEIDAEFLINDLPKTIDSMNSGTARLRQIVLSLRNFARLDEAEFKCVDIYDGINSTIMLLQHRLHQFEQRYGQRISITSDYAELPTIWCYASQLNQVFMALLNNAIDALEAKYQQTEQHPESATIQISTAYSDTQKLLTLQISDNGIGIPENHQTQIFDPFFTTKAVGQGTGLGLAICYQIMEQHSGQISCESKPNIGSKFSLQLPCPSPTTMIE